MRGVVDSEDLPLNISREMLQNNPQVAQIRKALTGRVLGELESSPTRTPSASPRSGRRSAAVLKEGIYEDHERRDQLLALARFATTKDGGLRSLKDYVADLRPNQTEIYYLVGDSIDRLKSNPKLEAARARGVEVLLLTDPVDALLDVDAARLRGQAAEVAEPGRGRFRPHAAARRGQAGRRQPAAGGVDDAAVIAAVKAALGERVSEVRASQRLTDSAACLVAAGRGPDRELERLLARQNRGAGSKPILELNMRHALVKALARAKADARMTQDVGDLAALLFEQAQILDGEVPDDPAAFAARMNRLIVRGLPGNHSRGGPRPSRRALRALLRMRSDSSFATGSANEALINTSS